MKRRVHPIQVFLLCMAIAGVMAPVPAEAWSACRITLSWLTPSNRPVNDGDVDHDGVPNFADGFDRFGNAGANAGGTFGTMQVNINPSVDLTIAKIRFTYSASPPVGVTRTGPVNGLYTYTPDFGNLRLWKKDGMQNRLKAEVPNGDFIDTGSAYSPSAIGGGYTFPVYVEGIAPSVSNTITVKLAPDGVNWDCSNSTACAVLKVDMTARRPCTEGPEFNNPFDEHVIPEDKEESPGAGIRVNGDTESAANENDLIKVELKVEPFPVPSGVTYVLKRSNSSIKVWDSRTMTTAILNSGTEAAITFSASTRTVWVENPSGGDADLKLIARSGSTDVCSDKIHFYDFTGIVVVFGGKDQVPNDPPDPNEGMFMVATNLYGLGYDVHMYFANDDQDAAFNEIVAAVQHRQVNNVAIFGYSWGGDETQEVAYRLDTGRAQIGTFSIRYTAYVDAVEELSGPQENLPLGTAGHDNYYQTIDYPHGVFIQGSRINVDVATLDPAVTHAHGANDPPPDHSIDNNATVRANIATQLTSQMDP